MAQSMLVQTPEGEELARLKAEVDALIDEATALDVDLRESEERLARFRVEYQTRIAPLMARVEFLEAEVARKRGEITDELIARADAAATAASEVHEEPPAQPEVPAEWRERMKLRHRALARRVHPDLADGDEDRERRHALMARLNEAWANGDEAAIAMLEAETFDLDAESMSVGDRLVALIQSRDALRNRIRSLQDEHRDLLESALEALRQQAEQAHEQGRDLLADLEAELHERAATLAAELGEVPA